VLCALDHSDSDIIHRPFLTVESICGLRCGVTVRLTRIVSEVLGLVVVSDVFLVKTCIFLEQALEAPPRLELKASEDRKSLLVYVR